MDVSGWSGGPTPIQRILPSPTSLRTWKPRTSRQNAREASGSSCGRVLVWIVMSMEVTLHALVDRRFSIPDRSTHSLHDAWRKRPPPRSGSRQGHAWRPVGGVVPAAAEYAHRLADLAQRRFHLDEPHVCVARRLMLPRNARVP